jgi:hypothetical protein
MGLIQLANERVRKLTIVDLKLLQFTAVFVALIIVKLIPQIMEINIWWFVVLAIIFGLRPVYVFCFKK